MTDDPAAPAAAAEPVYPLEAPGPLSQSRLWRLQRRYFDTAGVAAWSQNAVPSYVTSNPFIARAFSQVAAAFLRDARAAGEAGSVPGALPGTVAGSGQGAAAGARPVYVIELGAGSGRFAYHFLRQVHAAALAAELAAGLGAGRGPIRYVMTEYNPALIDFWEQHARLQPFVAAGQLDFALYDAESPAPLRLRHAGVTLEPPAGPLVLIANYFFDSVPQDAFYVDQGQIDESRVALHSTQPEPDADDPALLSRARLIYEHMPAPANYYGDREIDGLLAGYAGELTASALAFPITALRTLQMFRNLAGGELLLLTADKGYHRMADLQGRREPGFEVHGSFSMGVNYHALAEFCRRGGGQAHALTHGHAYLDTLALVWGAAAAATGTGLAFTAAVDTFGPEDFYLVQAMVEQAAPEVTVEQALALLRLSGWDSRFLQLTFGRLLAGLDEAPAGLRDEVREAIERVWENYYPIGETYDVPYDLGVLRYKLGDYPEALRYFAASATLHGLGAKTLYNMALCHYCLHNPAQALEYAIGAAREDPTFEAARRLAARLSGSQG